jgi:osmoprotectant transport system permease protein
MVSPRRAQDDRFLRAIKPLVGHVPVEAMREANYMVDRDENKASPEMAARWLEKKLGL